MDNTEILTHQINEWCWHRTRTQLDLRRRTALVCCPNSAYCRHIIDVLMYCGMYERKRCVNTIIHNPTDTHLTFASREVMVRGHRVDKVFIHPGCDDTMVYSAKPCEWRWGDERCARIRNR